MAYIATKATATEKELVGDNIYRVVATDVDDVVFASGEIVVLIESTDDGKHFDLSVDSEKSKYFKPTQIKIGDGFHTFKQLNWIQTIDENKIQNVVNEGIKEGTDELNTKVDGLKTTINNFINTEGPDMITNKIADIVKKSSRGGLLFLDTDNSDAGKWSASFGHKNKSDGQFSYSFGSDNIISNKTNYSTAFGKHNSIEGSYCVAMGELNYALNDYCLVAGNVNYAKGKYSIALGHGTQTETEGGFVCGKFNKTKDALFCVGNGTSSNRSDVFYITENGLVNCNNINCNNIIIKEKIIDLFKPYNLNEQKLSDSIYTYANLNVSTTSGCTIPINPGTYILKIQTNNPDIVKFIYKMGESEKEITVSGNEVEEEIKIDDNSFSYHFSFLKTVSTTSNIRANMYNKNDSIQQLENKLIDLNWKLISDTNEN